MSLFGASTEAPRTIIYMRVHIVSPPLCSIGLRKRHAEKCKNYQNLTMFKGSRWPLTFYFITRLCDMGENSKIDFFQVFHSKLYIHFHNQKSS